MGSGLRDIVTETSIKQKQELVYLNFYRLSKRCHNTCNT